ncbi:2-oxoglutarate-dependent dioxygenase ecdK-like isoform X1 [Branchiostoma floridae]|uniref:2-oxoglutarate-dependent dioxygenase ecdK-like isoform X1 n=2 Tax=Branchiostoma floridae TaxID=7739 RepID=A0A9J7LBS7_BRAFL|nr:2-oxoglutarate-dependent dioxygenase ecdK-like isoform X1 [Branchiostoma floridae]
MVFYRVWIPVGRGRSNLFMEEWFPDGSVQRQRTFCYTGNTMEDVNGYIQMIDFSAYSLGTTDIDEAAVQALSENLMHSFTTSGFAYLKNTGITDEQVTSVFDVADKFYDLPVDVKQKYRRNETDFHERHGWVCMEGENLGKLNGLQRPPDLKELFNIKPPLSGGDSWPSEVPEFEETCMDFFNQAHDLAKRVLELIARGLGTEAADFLDMFKFIGKGRNSSHLRSIRYPPVPETVKENQVRCGEHTDFGCITLLFQDNAGLEVAKGDGEFVAAPPITDTVVINIADTLQRWSADKLVSTKHRVMLPYTPETRGTTRRCVTFFTHPDFDAVMKCLDGSDKYPPVRAEDYVASRLRKMYL